MQATYEGVHHVMMISKQFTSPAWLQRIIIKKLCVYVRSYGSPLGACAWRAYKYPPGHLCCSEVSPITSSLTHSPYLFFPLPQHQWPHHRSHLLAPHRVGLSLLAHTLGESMVTIYIEIFAGNLFCEIMKKLALWNIRGFNIREYVACLVLRPVTDKSSRFLFSRMQTNSRNTWKSIHCENFTAHANRRSWSRKAWVVSCCSLQTSGIRSYYSNDSLNCLHVLVLCL